jgi:hypothetical protein
MLDIFEGKAYPAMPKLGTRGAGSCGHVSLPLPPAFTQSAAGQPHALALRP